MTKSIDLNHYLYDFDVYKSPSTEIPSELLLGDNEKKLLVVIKKEDFSAENRNFLSKILAAVKYELEKDAVIFSLPDGVSFSIADLVKESKMNDVILFGVNPKEVGFSFETIVYVPHCINKVNILIAHGLEQIKVKTDLKKALWAALQQMFLK